MKNWFVILRRGEIVLIRIGFHQTTGGKVRPALVLLDSGDDDFVAAPVTSQSRNSPFDLPLVHWREAGLNIPSTARIHKLCVLIKDEIVRSIGVLSGLDQDALTRILRSAFWGGWGAV
jgi:mRNA interferase MazF